MTWHTNPYDRAWEYWADDDDGHDDEIEPREIQSDNPPWRKNHP